jgi:hypothetical protein
VVRQEPQLIAKVENYRRIQLSKYTRPVFYVLVVYRIKWTEIEIGVNKKNGVLTTKNINKWK